MSILCSLITAFSMFSILPMPEVPWDEKSKKHILIFFPLVGVVEGLIFFYLGNLIMDKGFPDILRGALFTAFPLIYTGGIHMDGFLDTMDAFFSRAGKEKRLEILHDPHVGGFAVIAGGLYLVMSLGVYSALTKEMIPVVSMCFVFSRILSALSVEFIPLAKVSSLVASFKEDRGKGVKPVLIIFLLTALVFSALRVSVSGCCILAVTGIVTVFLHYLNSVKNFGGITGDLSGAFLTIYELLIPLILVTGKYL